MTADLTELTSREVSPESVVARLDTAAKVRLLSGHGFWALEPVPEAGLEGIVVTDGPHGLRCQVTGGDHLGLGPAAPATCFPPAVTMGSTWDRDLVGEVGAAIGREAVAQGVAVVLGPGLNIKRHPAGGRCFEYYSEDPLLSGRLAAAAVEGIQSEGVGACVKHFAVNNQETNRLVVDAIVDERTLRELYLAGFEEVICRARPQAVMSSYNRLNGTYLSDNVELLTTILRDEWGFDGLVMSDWGGTNDRVAGVRAGMDLEMPGSHGAFDAEVLAALESGELSQADLERCVARVVALLQRHQRPPLTAVRSESTDDSTPDSHHRLCRRAAAAGTVLLVNDGTLPLAASGTIAVVGGLAVHPRFQGAGSSQVNATRVDKPLTELRARVGDTARVIAADGYDARTGKATDRQISEAVEVAGRADVVVCFVGLPARWESEGFDRPSLDLPKDQVRLIEALATTGTPLVVVLNNGGVVHMDWADRVNAVVECWLGGQAGGGAVVDVLFGDVEPGGRLAESIPFHVAQLPADRDFPGHPRQVRYREGLLVGYRFHETAGVPARFPFGFGLSYTSFEWTDIEVTGQGTDLTVSVTVTNTGDRPGSDVVQIYVEDPDSTVARPRRELKGFSKVHLEPGASEQVTVALDRRSFAVWDPESYRWLVEAGRFNVMVARSSADVVETIAVDIESPDRLGADPRPAARAATDAEFEAMLGRPIPAPDAARPFHRNSSLADLEATVLGRRVLSPVVVSVGLRKAAKEFPDPDEATVAMFRAALRDGPVRCLVLLSEGMIRFTYLDRLLSWLNRGR